MHTATAVSLWLAVRLCILAAVCVANFPPASPASPWLCVLVSLLHVAYTTTALCIRTDLDWRRWRSGLAGMSPPGFGVQQAGICVAVGYLAESAGTSGMAAGAAIVAGHAVYAFVSAFVFDDYARRGGRV